MFSPFLFKHCYSPRCVIFFSFMFSLLECQLPISMHNFFDFAYASRWAKMEKYRTCWGCQRPVDFVDRFCRYCGRSRDKTASWIHNPWIILALLFLVMGPLALPLLWKSNGFSMKQKVAVSAANILYTLLLLVSIVVLVQKYMTFLLELSQP